jgi:hypothetical protein
MVDRARAALVMNAFYLLDALQSFVSVFAVLYLWLAGGSR